MAPAICLVSGVVSQLARDLRSALLFEPRPDALQRRKPQNPALNALLTALLSTRNLIAPIIAHAAFDAFDFAAGVASLWRIYSRAWQALVWHLRGSRSLHSMTWSANRTTASGIDNPSALAVFRLRTK